MKRTRSSGLEISPPYLNRTTPFLAAPPLGRAAGFTAFLRLGCGLSGVMGSPEGLGVSSWGVTVFSVFLTGLGLYFMRWVGFGFFMVDAGMLQVT